MVKIHKIIQKIFASQARQSSFIAKFNHLTLLPALPPFLYKKTNDSFIMAHKGIYFLKFWKIGTSTQKGSPALL